MQKRTILVIAEKKCHRIYRDIFSDNEKYIFQAFQNAPDIVDVEADIIIIDCGLDEKKGILLLEATKDMRPHLPVVLAAEASSDEMAIKAFKRGARDYIKKPFSKTDLLSVVDDILALKESSRERRKAYIPRIRSEPHIELTANIKSERILKAIMYMEDNLTEKISLQHLANQADMDRHYFCRLFKKHAGKSPMEFLSLMRIKKSIDLLNTAENISMIAIKVGFNTPGNFSRQFKRITGVTPREYRKKPSVQ